MLLPGGPPGLPILALNEVQTAAAAGFVRVADFLQARRMGHFPESARDVPGVGPVWTRQQIETWLAGGPPVTSRMAVADSSQPHAKAAPSSPSSGIKPAMMRVRDVADRWALDDDTIYGMIRRGELEARRFGARCIQMRIDVVTGSRAVWS